MKILTVALLLCARVYVCSSCHQWSGLLCQLGNRRLSSAILCQYLLPETTRGNNCSQQAVSLRRQTLWWRWTPRVFLGEAAGVDRKGLVQGLVSTTASVTPRRDQLWHSGGPLRGPKWRRQVLYSTVTLEKQHAVNHTQTKQNSSCRVPSYFVNQIFGNF